MPEENENKGPVLGEPSSSPVPEKKESKGGVSPRQTSLKEKTELSAI